MRKALAAALALLLLAGCADRQETAMTGQERTRLYQAAILSAQAGQDQTVVVSGQDPQANEIFSALGLDPEDLAAYAVSMSLADDSAYTVAAFYPAPDREDAVLEALDRYAEGRKTGLADKASGQYEIAVNARTEVLEDGTVLMVMCQDQDLVFDAVRDRIEQASL